MCVLSLHVANRCQAAPDHLLYRVAETFAMSGSGFVHFNSCLSMPVTILLVFQKVDTVLTHLTIVKPSCCDQWLQSLSIFSTLCAAHQSWICRKACHQKSIRSTCCWSALRTFETFSSPSTTRKTPDPTISRTAMPILGYLHEPSSPSQPFSTRMPSQIERPSGIGISISRFGIPPKTYSTHKQLSSSVMQHLISPGEPDHMDKSFVSATNKHCSESKQSGRPTSNFLRVTSKQGRRV